MHARPQHGADGVLLDTSSGVMKADAVVCTLPLGVLQLAPGAGEQEERGRTRDDGVTDGRGAERGSSSRHQPP